MGASGCDDGAGEPAEGGDHPDGPVHERGWLPPEDRLWRHPSELGPGAAARAPAAGGGMPSGRGGPSGHRLLAGSVFTAGSVVLGVAVVVLVTGVLLAARGATSGNDSVLDSASSTTPSVVASTLPSGPGTCCGTAQAAVGGNLLRLVRSIEPSLLAVVPRGTPARAGTALVVAAGLAVTTAETVGGASSVTLESASGGRQAARVLGVDHTSNLAVLGVPTGLPVADVDGAAGAMLAPGQLAAAVTVHPGSSPRSAVTTSIVFGMVWSTDTPAGVDRATSTFSSPEVDTALTSADDGSALVGPGGYVDGIMDTQAEVGGRSVSVFLPISLVLGVTDQLTAGGAVRHGWLGIDAGDLGSSPTGTTQAATPSGDPGGGGAVVDSVDPGGAAARAGIRPGDVIEAVDGQAVRSLADLSTCLYVIPPGTRVLVSIERGGSDLTVTATLAASQ